MLEWLAVVAVAAAHAGADHSPLPAGLPDALTQVCAPALQQPDSAKWLAAQTVLQANRQFQQGELPAALASLRIAAALQPRDAAILDQTAQLELQLGQPTIAEAWWQQAVAAQGDAALPRLHWAALLADRAKGGDLDKAWELLGRAGKEAATVCLQAKIAAMRGQCPDSDRLADTCEKSPPRKQTRNAGELALARARCRFAAGEYEAALRGLDAAEAAGVDVAADRAELAAARKRVELPAAPADPKAARTATALARDTLAKIGRGQEPPDGGLQEAVAHAPLVAVGHAALAELAALRRDWAAAELLWLRALNLPMDNADRRRALVGLGKLYAGWQPLGRYAECAAALQAAQKLGALPALEAWTLMDALRQSGQLRTALATAQSIKRQHEAAIVALDPGQLRELQAHIVALQAAVGPRGEEPAAAAAVDDGPRSRAKALAWQDKYREAAAILQAEVDAGRGDADVLRDLANLQRGMGETDAAIATLLQCLRRHPNNGEVHWQLARWLQDVNRLGEAYAHAHRAVALGVADAVPMAVRQDLDEFLETPAPLRWLDRPPLQRMLGQLDRYLLAKPPQAGAEQAQAVHRDIVGQLQAGARLGWSALAIALAIVAWLGWRRYGGADLRRLLAANPDSGPEVQRILAAIRHEVLKHHTLALPRLCEAVEAGNSEAAQRLWEPLCGSFGDSAADRLTAYAGQLQQLGQACGVRLNLRRRDAAMAALFRGFAILRRQRRRLQRLPKLSPRARAATSRKIRQAGQWLNASGYGAVAQLLDALRLQTVTPELLQSAFASASQEPEFAKLVIVALQLLAVPAGVQVAVPKQVLLEILVNLFRNALAAADAGQPVRIGAAVSIEVSAITALETVCIAVLDCAAPLPVDRVHGAAMERGLGLANSQAMRFGGGIDVTQAPHPWQKAVLVRLPRAAAGELG